MSNLDRVLAPLARRIANLFSRAVVKLVDDGTMAQTVQVGLQEGETRSGLERLQNYGFTSVPHDGAEGVAMFFGGIRDHGILLVVDDRRYRMKGLESGEVAIYTDEGDSIVLRRGGNIEVNAGSGVTVNAPRVELNGGDDVVINAANVTVNATEEVNVTAPHVNLSGEDDVTVTAPTITLAASTTVKLDTSYSQISGSSNYIARGELLNTAIANLAIAMTNAVNGMASAGPTAPMLGAVATTAAAAMVTARGAFQTASQAALSTKATVG